MYGMSNALQGYFIALYSGFKAVKRLDVNIKLA